MLCDFGEHDRPQQAAQAAEDQPVEIEAAEGADLREDREQYVIMIDVMEPNAINPGA